MRVESLGADATGAGRIRPAHPKLRAALLDGGSQRTRAAIGGAIGISRAVTVGAATVGLVVVVRKEARADHRRQGAQADKSCAPTNLHHDTITRILARFDGLETAATSPHSRACCLKIFLQHLDEPAELD